MNHKRSLLQRVIFLFSVLVAASSIVFFLLLFLFFNTGSRNLQDISRRREVMAWSAFLGGYYTRNSGWENLDRILLPEPLPRQGRGNRDFRMGHHNSMMMPHGPKDFRLASPSVYDSQGIHRAGPPLSRKDLKESRAYPVTVDGTIVGRFYLPPIRRFQVPAGERRLMGILSLFLGGFALFTPVLFLLLGSRFLKKLFKPIDTVTAAAEKAALGDFSVRIPEQGTGEVFTLIRQFNRMTHSMERSESWKRRLISDTAHELRTPVSLLQGRLEMIKEGLYPFDTAQVDTLYSDVMRLGGLIKQLQDLSSLEGDRAALADKTVECRALIQQVADSFKSVLDEKNIVLEYPSGEDDLLVSGRPVQIQQLFSNVIANAVEFSPRGSSIILKAGIQDSLCRFSIEDSGPGIPVERREDVFQRYFRLDESRNRKLGGTGLGLAICRAIAESHGGAVYIADKSSPGTRVVIELPQKR